MLVFLAIFSYLCVGVCICLVERLLLSKEPMPVQVYAAMLLFWPAALLGAFATADFWDKEI